MNRRSASIVIVALIVLLAGCGGGGGGGGDVERSVDITNDQRYASGVAPSDSPTIKADVTDEDEVDAVNLSYTAYDRAGNVTKSGVREMSKEGDRYRASLPALSAGYRVEYEVRARYDDGETLTDNATYTVSYVSSVDGPSDNVETANTSSDVSVTLYTTQDVQRVELAYNRTLKSSGTEESGRTVLARNPTNTTLHGAIPNERDGENLDAVDVNYTVRVMFGADNVTRTYETGKRSYRYRNDRPDVLYVPVTFDDSTSQTDFADPKDVNATLDTKAAKTMEYYLEESRGKQALDYEWVRSDRADDHFVLPGDPLDYRGELEDENNYTIQQGNATIRVSQRRYAHDEKEIMCTAYDTVQDQTGVNYDAYQSVVYVYPKLNGTETTTWETANETMTLPNGTTVPGNNRTYVVDRGKNWENAIAYGELAELTCGGDFKLDLDTRHVLIIESAKYGTHAHELGHGLFDWADYYGTTSDERGITGDWALMGSGNYNDEYPSQVMSYHKLRKGWIERELVLSSDLDRGDNRTVFMPYMKDRETVDPGHRAVDYRDDDGVISNVFRRYIFEARDPPNADLPSQPGTSTRSDRGLVAYAVGGGQVNVVWSQTPNSGRITDPDDPTLAATNYTGRFHDPDTGLEVTLDRDPRSPGEGLMVNMSEWTPRNLKGVNVFYRIDCQNITSPTVCSTYQSDDRNDTPVSVGVMAYTDEGRVGTTANGTVVNEVDGAYVVSAGNVQKVYIPRDRSARFVVNTSRVPANGSVAVTSQTVTRDGDGERTASGLENETVRAGETDSPPLARFNLSTEAWDAGRLRTLETNDTVVTVRNTGIEALENVTVRTEGDVVEVNRTRVGRIGATNATALALTADVPGGKPVGEYTYNVTLTGEGQSGARTATVPVTVRVLPTVYWEGTPADADRTIATENATRVTVVVANDEASNVPLRDVSSAVTGPVTALDVDASRFVDAVAPGENATLTTTVSVPADGIENGTYRGTITVSPLRRYGEYFSYPVTLPEGYVVPDQRNHTTSVSVDAVGPSVNSSASFHPDEQVAMRKGAATERVTVDPVAAGTQVPAERITVRAEVPEGWTVNGADRGAAGAHLTAWVVRETSGETPAGEGGKRVKLDADDYEATVVNDTVVFRIDDVRDTEFGRYVGAEHVLEFEFKLNKRIRADEYEYASQVDAATTSPVNVYRQERPTAEVAVFDPPSGTPAERVSNGRSRVSRGRVAVAEDRRAIGTNATLTPEGVYVVGDGDDRRRWGRFTLRSADGNRSPKNFWVPVERANGSYRIAVAGTTETGDVVLDGVVTRNVRGAVSSALRDGKAATVTVPVDGNASRVKALRPAVRDGNDTATITLTAVDAPATAAVNMTADSGGEDIPVVVGDGVFDARVDSRDDRPDRADDGSRG